MKKGQLSPPLQRLVEQCQRVNFGRVTFHVHRGEPDLSRPWRTRRTLKLAGGDNGPRPEADLADFELRLEQKALIEALRQVRDGECVALEVRHGLPFIAEIEQEHQAA